MEDLMTVKTSDFEANLVIAKSYLIDNGIDCIINTEYLTVSTKDGNSARLQVRGGDYQKAIELLIKGGFTKREDYEYTPD